MWDTSLPARDARGAETQFVHYIDQAGIWSINPYRQCEHNCLYCIAGSQGRSEPWHPAAAVVPALRSHLTHLPDDIELFVGALVDAYPTIELTTGITRLVLRELVNQERPFCITTKSDLVTRDLDLLCEHAGHCDVIISLSTLDADVLWTLEPGAPTAAQRLDAVRELHAAGIQVAIDASPWIPGISRADEIIDRRPHDVPVQFAPLDLGRFGGSFTLGNRTYTQHEIDTAYLVARESVGSVVGVVWKDPTLV